MRKPIFGLLVAGLSAGLLFFSCAVIATTEQPAVDLVVVIKSERTMYLYSDGLLLRQFNIGLGDQPVGDKFRSGDEKTPEGGYVLNWRNPDSQYYLSIHISYPNAVDRARAKTHGVDPGGNIMIHGQPNYARNERTGDWTNGCIAVSNKAMDFLWRRVPMGTRIHILP